MDEINNFIDNIEKATDTGFGKEAETHIKEEFSTYDWILKEMLKRVGFSIDKVEYVNEKLFTCFVCTKK